MTRAVLGHGVCTCSGHFPLVNKCSSGHLLLLLLISGMVLMLGSKVFFFEQMSAKFVVTKMGMLLSSLIWAYRIVAQMRDKYGREPSSQKFCSRFFFRFDNPTEPTPLSNSSTLTALSKHVTTHSKSS